MPVFANGETIEKALVIYDSMWGSTERMARAIVDGMASREVEVKLFDLCNQNS